MTRTVPHLAALVAIWVALWQDVSVANVLSGLLVGAALLLVFRAKNDQPAWPIRPIPALKFAAYFMWKLVQASLVVAWEVATPRNSINEGIVAVPIAGPSRGLVTLVANAISLTPGTLTIDADLEPPVLYVHVLHLGDVTVLREEILRLERLAIAAFAPKEHLV